MNIEVKIIEIITEDATANASNTAGMGSVISSQPSILPGVTIGANSGTIGSGDIGTTLSGNPFQKEAAKKKSSKNIFALKQDWTKKPHKAGSKKKSRIRKFSNFAKK
jgi:hypothetical protein